MGAAIPASAIVNVNPAVIGAGGSALDLSGLALTTSYRVPIGTVKSFSSQANVAAYFGSGSLEATLAGVYFLGFDNSNVKPGAVLFSQYPTSAVPAYLQSGPVSGLTLAQLQALSGTIIVTINGKLWTSGAINFTGVASFSAAATAIQTALAAYDAVVTGKVDPGTSAFTATITATDMNVTAQSAGSLFPGQTISGGTTVAGTKILSQTSGTPGGIGHYQVDTSQSATGVTTATSTSGLLTVTAVASGALAVGQTISGGAGGLINPATKITQLLTGAGGNGLYVVDTTQTVASGTVNAGPALVTYDSVSGSFFITGGTPGAASTIGFATGTLSTAINFTQATGAVTSQGAAIYTPSAAMDAIVAQTQDWVTFWTMFTPSVADKIAFSAWTNVQDNQYLYAMWDTDVVNTQANPSTTAYYAIKAANYSGTAGLYEPSDQYEAAFLAGSIASIDFTETNGRTTMAFRSQTGLAAGVTNQTVGDQLIANGMNFYGRYATRNDQFTFFYPGQISGPFKWIDSYVNQIKLNNDLQLALLELLITVKSVPYDADGYALLEAACMDPINAAVNFGSIRAGVTLSAAQIAEVNNAAGVKIDGVLAQRGWYLQIKDAAPSSRAARSSPPMTLWYMDGESVQKVSLASIEVQ